MENIILEILTDNPYYGKVLSDVLKRNYKGFVISLTILSEGDIYTRPDPCLSDLVIGDLPRFLGKGDILLVDTPNGEESGDLDGPAKVFKYTSARELIGKILEVYGENTGRKVFYSSELKGKIVAIASPKGGAGCSTLTMSLARDFQRYRNKRCLCISLEQFPEYTGNQVYSVKNLIYRVKKNMNEFWSSVGKAILTDEYGVRYLEYGKGDNPLLNEDSDTIYRLLSGLMEWGKYDMVFVDCGNFITPAAEALMRAADQILLISTRDEREKKYLDYLCKKSGNVITEKLLKVCNMYYDDRSETEKFFDQDQDVLEEDVTDQFDFIIPRDREAFSCYQYTGEISMDGEYAKSISLISGVLEKRL